ncbi:metal ABC transporter ATP-binding protein [Lentilactobacillus laojiaonis]|uniref:metal ABC transporter ATP-binding protein n=1 Tax=Lentilactobacillus laojiaonis TaxID=2883998 RepID=UPI001D09E1A7|nr:ABC transporter ATP-binding protein [Lentilactobacillus laojiaonis]UDM31941.1 ABC transporter ATP-binding protein [Lentilactobacillus laojiaonis]
MKETLIKVQNLEVGYPNQKVFQNLSFEIHAGQFLAVIGENGIGKTTLIKTLLGQIKPLNGKIEIENHLKIGYVPQFRNIDIEYPLTIADFISLNFTGIKLPWLSKREKQKINEVLKQVNLFHLRNRPLGMVSGGEKQRAYLAQALIKNPELLILDESTASLDPKTKREVLEVVSKLNRELNITIIFISHDLNLVKEYPDSFLWLKRDEYLSGDINNLPDQLKGESHV